MRELIFYIQRWELTKRDYFVKNIVSSAAIFALACYAVKSGVFETYTDTKACLFTVLMCAIWSGIFNSIALFYSEEDYTTDDLNKILSVRVYIIANFIIQLVLSFIEAIVSCVIFSLFYNYDVDGILFSNANFDYLVTFFLVIFSADMLGFATGMLVGSITSAMTLIPILLIVHFLFSGCLFELDGILKSLSIYTTAKWGYSALGSISNLNHYLQKMNPMAKANSLFITTPEHLSSCWMHLILLIIICSFAAGILLYRKINYA